MDFVHSLLTSSKHRLGTVNFISGGLPKLPFKANSFDIVVASEVLYYLDDPAKAESITRIHEILKPGGFLFITSVLGERYLSISRVRELVNDNFREVDFWYEHHKWYHTVFSPLRRALRLQQIIRSGYEPGLEESALHLRKFLSIYRNFVFRHALQAICWCLRPLFKRSFIPAIMNIIAKRCNLTQTRTNFAIVVTKRD